MAPTIVDLKLSFRGAQVKRAATQMIVLHHLAGNASVKAVHAYHLARLHKGIDYNFVVLKDGTIVKGRGIECVGGHVKGKLNNVSIGIAAQGNFEKEQMPGVQKNAVIALVRWCMQKYPSVSGIYGHRQLKALVDSSQSATACPGKNYPLAAIKSACLAGGSEPPRQDRPPAPAKPVGSATRFTYVYSAASLSGKKLLKLGPGNLMDLLGVSGSFYKVNAAGKVGYVPGAHVKVVSGAIGTPAPLVKVGRLLKRGVEGSDVKALQEVLKALGFFTYFKCTGYFGSITRAAVKKFQKAAGLKVDGIVGQNTTRALGGVWAG
jgi:N-acetyl-anhydromuramyl-L-alanine amidase AmpD